MSDHREEDFALRDSGEDVLEVPRVRVTVSTPGSAPQTAMLALRPIIVGTGSHADLVVNDARVSRRHCEMSLTERGIRIRDLGSRNGTVIHEVRVVEAIFPPRAVATIGNSKLSVALDGGRLPVQLSASTRFGDAIGGSLLMRALFASLERATVGDAPVLLSGESGTGKELLARALHAHSARRDGPFVKLDCAAVAPSDFSATLFGAAAQRGALEQASGGVLFLRSIGEVPHDAQQTLFQALDLGQFRRIGAAEWRPLDVRVVATTHKDLHHRIAAGLFREELYEFVSVTELDVPPLHARKGDIPLLVEALLAAQVPPRSLAHLAPNALEFFEHYHWPGNVRELRNMVARLVLHPDATIDAMHGTRTIAHGAAERASRFLALTLRDARALVVEEFEKAFVDAKMRAHAGDIPSAAEASGLSRPALIRLLDRYGWRGDGE